MDREEISTAFSVPRLMGFEYGLATKITQGTSLEELSDMISSKMYSLQKADDSSISSPLHLATITRQGVVQETL